MHYYGYEFVLILLIKVHLFCSVFLQIENITLIVFTVPFCSDRVFAVPAGENCLC